MWDIAEDEFGSLVDSGFLKTIDLSLDEPNLEAEFVSFCFR